MKVLIVEDEPLAQKRISRLIHEFDPEIELIDVIDNTEDLSRFLKSEETVDLIFLDIELSDGRSLDILDILKPTIPIVFTTAYSQHALKAFNYLSVDYLLKPIETAALRSAINKYRDSFKPKNLDLESLREALLESRSKTKTRFLTKSGKRLYFKSVDDIAYFVADGKLTFMGSKTDNKKYLINHTLEELERTLDENDFFRISRKYIVSASSIRDAVSLNHQKMEVRLAIGQHEKMTVSRERIPFFKAWLNQ